MKVNFSRISKAEMQSFIDKFNKDVAKRTDLKKQLKELSKQPRKNKAEIETLNGKIDKLNTKITKNRATMKEYLDKVGTKEKKTVETKKKTTTKKVATIKKPVEVFATELKENDIIVDPFNDGNDLKIIGLFVAPDTVWVEFDNGEKLGYAIDKKTKAKVLR